MADKKISELTEKIIPIADDILAIVDSEAIPIATKKIKVNNVTKVHAADLAAHKVAEGRPRYGTTNHLSLPGVSVVSVSTRVLAADRVYYSPIVVVTSIVVDTLVIEVTAAASSGKKARAGIYKADINWQPTDLVVASAEIAIDGIAVVSTTITETTLTPGRYLIPFTIQEAATFRRVAAGVPGAWGFRPILGASALSWTAYVDKAYSALSDPGVTWDSPQYTTVPAEHYVFLNIKTP